MTKLIFLSPIISLLILFFISYYIYKKSKEIKITPTDHLDFKRFQIKIFKNFYEKRLKIFIEKIKEILLSLYKKFLQRIKTEALKTQIWAEKKLEKFKDTSRNF
ncbi:MAG: hypothetical protein ACP5JU_01295 [Minisyncoccia bacterium]